MTKGMLYCLYRNTRSIPLVIPFFGLSDAEDVLSKCGLSRLPRSRVKTLDLLSHEETASAIRTVFVTYDFKGSSKDHKGWVDALAELSQGWPQHINGVSVAACQVICDHGENFDKGLLSRTLELGRLRRCSEDPAIYQYIAIEAGKAANGDSSCSKLRNLTATLLEHSKAFCGFPSNALHAGVLMETEDLPKHCWIPIPSLGDYLRGLPVN
ncbi:MAG: hypothetical protein OXF73_03150 [Gammaproteobacteria bacterium]|nr:hypothetical protein [Gammaproteobacteria bacterium]